MAEDDKAAADLAARIGELLSRAVADEVRARVAIGALLDGHTSALAVVSGRVGLGVRALRQCVEVHRRIPAAELNAYLAGPRVPPWSALVILGRITSRTKRAAVMGAWTDRTLSMRELRRLAQV